MQRVDGRGGGKHNMAARVPDSWGSILQLFVLLHVLFLVRLGERFNSAFSEFFDEVAECLSWAAKNEPPLIADPQQAGYSFWW